MHAQHHISIEATLLSQEGSLDIEQQIVYKNTSNVILNEIFISDWANSFSSKTTPLGERFSENYISEWYDDKGLIVEYANTITITDNIILNLNQTYTSSILIKKQIVKML